MATAKKAATPTPTPVAAKPSGKDRQFSNEWFEAEAEKWVKNRTGRPVEELEKIAENPELAKKSYAFKLLKTRAIDLFLKVQSTIERSWNRDLFYFTPEDQKAFDEEILKKLEESWNIVATKKMPKRVQVLEVEKVDNATLEEEERKLQEILDRIKAEKEARKADPTRFVNF